MTGVVVLLAAISALSLAAIAWSWLAHAGQSAALP